MYNLFSYLQFRGEYYVFLCMFSLLFCTQLLQYIANRFAMDDWGVPIMLFTLSLSHTRAVWFLYRS